MNLINTSTVLFVQNIRISRDFYENVLQLHVEFDFGKNIIFTNGIAIWEIQGNHVIPRSFGMRSLADSSVHRFELYFETENLPEVYEKLQSMNVKFLHEMLEENWGQRTLRFFDPDGHLIEIGETMRQFICRLYFQGFSIEEICGKTNVTMPDVNKLLNLCSPL
jgi:catechol 2,3-dioxygenase-like lactoylglutathione lyase family enzyme